MKNQTNDRALKEQRAAERHEMVGAVLVGYTSVNNKKWGVSIVQNLMFMTRHGELHLVAGLFWTTLELMGGKFERHGIQKLTESNRALLEQAISERVIHFTHLERWCKFPVLGKRDTPVAIPHEVLQLQNDCTLRRAIEAGIDFSEWGWVTKFSAFSGMSYQHVKRWFLRWHPEFYDAQCYQRLPPT